MPTTLDPASWAAILAIVAVTHWLGGLTAFGSTLLAFPMLTWLMDVGDTRTFLLVLGALQCYQVFIFVYRDVDWRLLGRMALLASLGLPIGIVAVHHLPQRPALLFLGAVLVAGAATRLWPVRPHHSGRWPRPVLDGLLVIGGIIHGAFACGGPALALYAQHVVPAKRAFRGTLTAFWVVVNTILMVALCAGGDPIAPLLPLLAVAVPLVLVMTHLGNLAAHRLSQERFAKIVAVLLVVAGVITIGRAMPWGGERGTERRPAHMTQPSIVCQTITFGESQRERFGEVFRAVADAGYTGVEIGFRHIAAADPGALRRQLADFGLALVASHVGGNLEDAAQASGERNMLDTVVEFLERGGCGLLMYSGLRWQSAEQVAADIAMLNRGARRCAQSGVRLLYHNHNWEFENDGRVMNALLASACDALGLCPDLGWVHKGGADPVKFLERNRARLGAVHFKDFATMKPVTDTVVLGTGVAPLREAAAWLRANRPDLPVIAEQDTCEGDPAAAVKGNAAFLIAFCRHHAPEGGKQS